MQPLGLEPTSIDSFNLVLEVLKTPQCQCHPYSQSKMSTIAVQSMGNTFRARLVHVFKN